jgi:hypothetical protein
MNRYRLQLTLLDLGLIVVLVAASCALWRRREPWVWVCQYDMISKELENRFPNYDAEFASECESGGVVPDVWWNTVHNTILITWHSNGLHVFRRRYSPSWCGQLTRIEVWAFYLAAVVLGARLWCRTRGASGHRFFMRP